MARVRVPKLTSAPNMRVKGGARGKRNTGPAIIPKIPVKPRINWRLVNIAQDMSSALRVRGRRGLRLPVALSEKTIREDDYQRWLRRVGAHGTRPEWAVFDSLERKGLRAPQSDPPGMDFQYQVPLLGGRSRAGGAVADIVIYTVVPPVVIRVQGEFWHFKDDEAQADDFYQRLALENEGFRVVDILAQDTLTRQRTDEVVGYALNGFELDETGRLAIFR